MKDEKREIRTIACQLAVREPAPDAAGESRTITGTAIVFDAESEELDDWGDKFREIISRSAVTMEWLNTQDVKLNLLHDRDMTLARCNKGVGNLRMMVTERGLDFEFDAPRCDIGDRALALIREGVYSGCSFEFYPQDYDKSVDGDKVTIRHTKFRKLTALTIGMDPAYRQTSVNVRELLGEKNPDEDADAERERLLHESELRREAEHRSRVLRLSDDEIDYYLNYLTS